VSPGPSDRQRREQEAIVKRLLRDLPYADPTLSGQDPGRPPGGGRGAGTSGPARPIPPQRPRAGAAWLWTLLSLVTSAAVPFWPYARDCGSWLGLYGAVVTVVLVVTLRAVWVSWRDRIGAAHGLALLVLLWGLALGADVVLPRVGYAAERAGWRCALPVPPAAPPPAALPPAADTLPPVAAPDSTGA
jgi:hypothetical protein